MTHHEHDLGLQHDLPVLLGWRRLLGLLAGAGLVGAAGCSAPGEIPQETAGPYPGDGSNGPNVLTDDPATWGTDERDHHLAARAAGACDGYSASVADMARTSLASTMVFGDDGAKIRPATMTGTVGAGLTAALTVPVA